MKKGRRISIICIVAALLWIVYVARFRTLNDSFSKGELYIIPNEQSVNVDGVEYKIKSANMITGKEYRERYNAEDVNDNDKIIVVYYNVKNNTDDEAKIGISDTVLTCGVWFNGVDYFNLWNINGDDYDDMVASGEERQVGASFLFNGNMDRLKRYGEDWRLRLTEWPVRVELQFTLNGGDTQ